jgi:quercetin dioxygenase-like cupin family protein
MLVNIIKKYVMPHKGQKWVDPQTGDIAEMLATSKETKGEKVVFKMIVKPGGFKPPEHIHLKQDESFEILSGKLTYSLNGKKKTANAGEKIILSKGIGHTHYNAEAGEDLVMVQTISPALDCEIFLENLFGLTHDGKIKGGEPKFLQIMAWSNYYQSKTFLATLPLSLQKFIAFASFPLAKLLGYKAVYKKYSGYNA